MRHPFKILLLTAAFVGLAASPAGATNWNPRIDDRDGPGRTERITQIVIHTAESGETGGAANGVCAYLARTSNASIHYCTDNVSITPAVPENRVAWHAAHRATHNRSIGIEQAGRAGQNWDQWHDAYSQGVITTTALLVAQVANRYGIPIRHLTNAQVARAEAGILGHNQVSEVLAGDHWDPGPSYPWNELIDRANYFAGRPIGQAEPVTIPQATPTSSPSSSGVYGIGSRGETVRTIQRLVGASPDGVYGPQTAAAVRAFQARAGIAADGVWGPQTQAAMERVLSGTATPVSPASPARPTLRQGSRGSAVSELQRRLNARGARLTVDGVFGPRTRAAVVAFQGAQRIAVDGIVGPQTWGRL